MSNNDNNNQEPVESSPPRRSSFTSNSLAGIFGRSNSTSTGSGTQVFPNTATNMNDRRRLSISTLGLSGVSSNNSTATFGIRRSSMSTNNSESIDENAVDDDDVAARTAPATPFTRRMSFGAQAMRNMRAGPGAGPVANDQGYNWSEQLRSRAESTVAAGGRPSFSFPNNLASSPPGRAPLGAVSGASGVGTGPPLPSSVQHDRTKSVPEMPAPPAQSPKPRSQQRPDAFQERILKGDFYMD